MAGPDKETAVAELGGFRDSNGAVLTDYRGLTVKLSRSCVSHSVGATSHLVTKNTLTKIAAKEAGVADEDPRRPDRHRLHHRRRRRGGEGLRDFAKANSSLIIREVPDGNVLEPAEIQNLADLESREVLLAELAGGMKASLDAASLSRPALADRALARGPAGQLESEETAGGREEEGTSRGGTRRGGTAEEAPADDSGSRGHDVRRRRGRDGTRGRAAAETDSAIRLEKNTEG